METLHTLLRHTVVALLSTEDRNTFVVHTARKILSDTQGTSGGASSLAAGLLCSLLVWLDRESDVFADFDAHDGMLRSCGDLAIQVVEQSDQSGDVVSAVTEEQFGAAQLLALLVNKVPWRGVCVAVNEFLALLLPVPGCAVNSWFAQMYPYCFIFC